MPNPWEEISIEDYENHMSRENVFQLQTLNAVMKERLCDYSVKAVMILGVAGGNGLEHIDKAHTQRVYGVDVNESYLRLCKKRYPFLENVLETIRADLTDETINLPQADLLTADLLIEYIGCECFKRVVNKVSPQFVSCTVQVNSGEKFVSDSPYIHAFDGIYKVLHSAEETELSSVMTQIDYKQIKRAEYPLPNGKSFVRIDFSRR